MEIKGKILMNLKEREHMHQLKGSGTKRRKKIDIYDCFIQVKLLKKDHHFPHCKPMTHDFGSAFELSVLQA